METGAVYNSTTVPAGGAQNRYLDNISYASLNPKRCANVAIVVVGILAVLGGLSLILYGSLFYVSVRDPVEYETPMERDRRHSEMLLYQILLYAGIPLLALGCLLWIVYLYRTGRCKYCPLCPGARKRRRAREHFEAQRLEADNISNGYSTHPTTTLPLDEQDRLVKHNLDEYTGLNPWLLMEAAFSQSPAPLASCEDLAEERHRPRRVPSGDSLAAGAGSARSSTTAHASLSTNSSEFPRLSPSRGLTSDFACSSLSRAAID